MSAFQQIALGLTLLWLAAVALRFRRSTPVLLGGLVGIGTAALLALAFGKAAATELGLALPASWLATLAWAAGWTALMFAYSPVADRLARQVFAAPPTLKAFRAIQHSAAKLIAGIAIAWLLGGFFEELVFRGVLLRAVEAGLGGWLPSWLASAVAIAAAAIGAGIVHWYQGPRAMVIITQLSMLFGLLFVLTGHNLYAVILAHGFFDTIAFVRFARGTSRYAKLGADERALS
ncbi:MAG: CPBP family intramembrane metalloprotease [Alphaproteobacteria bacterium]|nr:CPBP family intramembrane metalloprotease [Alphaproteobacteria bacterium]